MAKKSNVADRPAVQVPDADILNMAQQFNNDPATKMAYNFREHAVLMELLEVCSEAAKKQVVAKLRGNVVAWMERPKDSATEVWLPRHVQVCATAMLLLEGKSVPGANLATGSLPVDAVQCVDCPYCQAKAGNECLTPAGNRAETHASRIAALVTSRPDVAQKSKRCVNGKQGNVRTVAD